MEDYWIFKYKESNTLLIFKGKPKIMISLNPFYDVKDSNWALKFNLEEYILCQPPYVQI